MNRNWRMTFVWTAAILALNNCFQLMVIYNAPRCRFQIQGKLSCCPGSGLLQDDCKMIAIVFRIFQVSLSNFIQHASLWTLWRNHGETMQATWVLIARICKDGFSPPRPGALVKTVGSMPLVATWDAAQSIEISTLAECRLNGQQQNILKNTISH